MNITGTVELGQLIQAGAVVVGFISAYYAIKGRLTLIENAVEDQSEKLELSQRTISNHQQQLADLNAAVFPHKRGRGGRTVE